MIEAQFPGQPALVFVHQPNMRSVPELSHAHVVLVGLKEEGLEIVRGGDV
jgi:hypothetical protein